jgi:outer membrane lipoprotein SlyB
MSLKNLQLSKLLVVGVIAAFMTACASSNSGSVYSRDDARKVQTVKTGVVESVRTVKLEGTKTPIGTAAGGVIGGVAGGSVGNGGRTSAVVAVLGAVAGAIAGSAIEEGVTRKDALEITVKLDGGNMIAIVQEADEAFKAGEKVRIVENADTSRVTH